MLVFMNMKNVTNLIYFVHSISVKSVNISPIYFVIYLSLCRYQFIVDIFIALFIHTLTYQFSLDPCHTFLHSVYG